MKVIKPLILICLFWLIIGMILSIKVPEIVDQIKIPNIRGGGFIDRKLSVYEFPIFFSNYMLFVTCSFLAFWLVAVGIKNSTKK